MHTGRGLATSLTLTPLAIHRFQRSSSGHACGVSHIHMRALHTVLARMS